MAPNTNDTMTPVEALQRKREQAHAMLELICKEKRRAREEWNSRRDDDLAVRFDSALMGAQHELEKVADALKQALIEQAQAHPRIGERWLRWKRERTRWNGVEDPDSPWVLSGEIAKLEAWDGNARNQWSAPRTVGEICLRILHKDGKPGANALSITNNMELQRHWWPEGMTPNDADQSRRDEILKGLK